MCIYCSCSLGRIAFVRHVTVRVRRYCAFLGNERGREEEQEKKRERMICMRSREDSRVTREISREHGQIHQCRIQATTMQTMGRGQRSAVLSTRQTRRPPSDTHAKIFLPSFLRLLPPPPLILISLLYLLLQFFHPFHDPSNEKICNPCMD